MSSHQSVTGTLTTRGQASTAFYLRPGEVVAVTLTITGTATVSLSKLLGVPSNPSAYEPQVSWSTNQTATQWRNTGTEPVWLSLVATAISGSVAFTLADVSGDQILQEWRAADGTLMARVTDQGIFGVGPYPLPGTTGSGVINVKDPQYGAVGDGVTDDTAAIQAAIDAAEARGGGVVQCVAGDIYRITSGLVIDVANTILDLGGSRITADFTTGWAVTIGDGVLVTRNMGVRNGEIIAVDTSTNLSGVRFRKNVRYIPQYDNLRIEEFKGVGLFFEELNWSTQQPLNTLVRNCGVGLDIDNNTNAVTIAGMSLDTSDTYNARIRGVVSITFLGGYIQFAGTAGVLLDTGTVGTMQETFGVSFVGTYFEDNGTSHIIGNDGRGLVVSGCFMNCDGMTGPAIDLNNWDGAFIHWNTPANLDTGTQRDFVDADANCTLIDVGRQAVLTGNNQQVCVQGGSTAGLINSPAKIFSALPTPNILTLGTTFLLEGTGTGDDRALPWMVVQPTTGTREFRALEMRLVKQVAQSVTSPYTPTLATRGIFDITVPNTGLTINAPSGPYEDGERMEFIFRQNVTGGGNLTWDAAYATDLSNSGNTANTYAGVTFRWSAGRSRWVQVGKMEWTA